MKPIGTLRLRRLLTVIAVTAGGAALGGPPAEGAEGAASPPSAVAACETFASAHSGRGAKPGSLRLLEEGLSEATAPRTVGSQVIATVLTGRGVWRDEATAPTDFDFVCLLESAGKPVFFERIDGARRDPAAVCWDGFEPAGWGPLTDCLQQALDRETKALETAMGAAREQTATSMDAAAATRALADSDARWAAYRDSECDRQQAFVAGRNHPDIGELTCRLRKTSERIADLGFDD